VTAAVGTGKRGDHRTGHTPGGLGSRFAVGAVLATLMAFLLF
jgi:hypothetical protein